MNVRDFLRDGVIRNAVNFPALPAEEYALARPWMQLATRLGSLIAQLATGRTHGVEHPLLRTARQRPLRDARQRCRRRRAAAVALIRGHHRQRAIRGGAARHRDHRNAKLTAARLHQSPVGEAAHERRRTMGGRHGVRTGEPRLASVDGVEIEAPLDGTLIVITNNDQPGVIGEVGTILGRHGLNIANFALGRGGERVPSVWSRSTSRRPATARCVSALDEIRAAKAIRTAALVQGLAELGARLGGSGLGTSNAIRFVAPRWS